MHTPLSPEAYQDKIDQAYADASTIQAAIEGDGGIIKNRSATVFPYHLGIDLFKYLYSSELTIGAKDTIRVALLGELASPDDGDRDSYFDVILFVDDMSYGVYRFQTGKWGYSDWSNIPDGKLKLALYNPDEEETSRIVGFGAIFTGD